MRSSRGQPEVSGSVFAIALIVLVQGFLLQPELARRTDLVLAGVEPGPAPHHPIYVALELAKMVLLGALALWRRGGPVR